MTRWLMCWVVLGDLDPSAPRPSLRPADWELLAGLIGVSAAIGIGAGLLRAIRAASPRKAFLSGLFKGFVWGLAAVLLYLAVIA